MPTKKSLEVNGLWTTACLFLYLAIVVFAFAHHELWQDEVAHFTFLCQPIPVLQKFNEMRTYGHPALWYAFLYLVHLLIPGRLALPAAHLFIVAVTAWFILNRAPFKPYEKILFLLGYFPIYEYAVICRNYNISMLFLFIVCALYTRRFERWIAFSAALFFFAQTHALSMILSTVIASSVLAEFHFRRPEELPKNRALAASGFALMGAGMLLACFEAMPPRSSNVTSLFLYSWGELARSLVRTVHWASLADAGIMEAFHIPNIWLASAVFFVTYALFRKKPFLLWIFFGGLVSIRYFFLVAYHGSLRHYAFIYLLWVGIFWIDRAQDNASGAPVRGREARFKNLFFVIILLLQIPAGFQAVRREITSDFSASKKAGLLIRSHPEWKDAILMGEPDAVLEALPYYVDNPLYFGREKRYGVMTHFDDRVVFIKYSLGGLLHDAIKLKRQTHRPVLIFIGYRGFERRFWFTHNPNSRKIFSQTPYSFDMFTKRTVKVGEFLDTIVQEEGYSIYLLR